MKNVITYFLTTSAILFSAWFFVDNRFMHAAHAEAVMSGYEQKLSKIEMRTQLTWIELRLDGLQFRLIELKKAEIDERGQIRLQGQIDTLRAQRDEINRQLLPGHRQ